MPPVVLDSEPEREAWLTLLIETAFRGGVMPSADSLFQDIYDPEMESWTLNGHRQNFPGPGPASG